MNTVFIYLLEASICLGVFYLFYWMVLHRQPSFQYNRVYLLATSALGWVLPLLNVPFGSVGNSPTAGKTAAYLLLSPAEIGSATAPAIDLVFWAGAIYGIGILISLALYGKQFYRLYRVVQTSPAQPVPHNRYRLLYTNGQFPTASFFRYLFWDNTQPLTAEETRQMMSHEETHIRQGHSYDVLYITLLKIIGWFHPLVYLYDRALTQTHEYAADAGVLKQTSVDQKAYARLLSKHMLTSRNVLPVNRFFYPSQILTRIHMIYANAHRTPWYRYVMIVPVFISLFLIFSCQEESEMTKLDDLSQQYKDAETEEEKNALADADETYMVVEDQPEPEGGMKAFYKYVTENLNYPTEARQKGIEGKVFVQFVVDKDGSLSEVKAIKGIGSGCDEEAVRVIAESPVWNPGKQRGKSVKVRMVMPINFRLGEEEPKAETDAIKNDQGGMKVQISKQGSLAKGTVVSENGDPLAGANIVIKGTNRGTVTDTAGEFTLQLEDEDNEPVVVVSFVGYQSKQIEL